MTDIHPSGELHCLREAERKLFPDIQHLRIRVKDTNLDQKLIDYELL